VLVNRCPHRCHKFHNQMGEEVGEVIPSIFP